MTGPTLGYYLATSFLRYTGGVFLLFFCLIVAIDIIEFSRRVSSIADVGIGEISLVVVYRAPAFAENILPFAVMFGAVASLLMLNRRLELVVARAAGVSVWQFLLPLIVSAALLGSLASLAYNPLAIAGRVISDALEANIFSRENRGAQSSSKAAWIRLNQTGGDVILRAQVEQNAGLLLTSVIAFRYSAKGDLVERIDATTAKFVEHDTLGNHYVLSDLVSTVPGEEGIAKTTAILPVKISKSQLQADRTSAENVSVWGLIEEARRAQQAGKNTLPFNTRFHALLSAPVLFVAMVLLAATVSLTFARFGINGKAILAGIFGGFVLYILSKLLVTFGSNGLVPPFIAAWSPAIVASLIGITVLLHQEDG